VLGMLLSRCRDRFSPRRFSINQFFSAVAIEQRPGHPCHHRTSNWNPPNQFTINWPNK
jgi:hypothetical protein